MSGSNVSQINVYPVKSVAGISLSTAWVEKQGLSFDRRFMLATAEGGMVTARKYPQMVTIRSCLLADGVRFSAPGQPSLTVKYADLERKPAPAQVWNDKFSALTTTAEANDWFSAILNFPVQLLYCGEQSQRVREKFGHNVSFADGYPLLLISEASLAELNRRSPEQHSMDQFRTNLVVSGDEPFIEDSWKRIRIGEVEFELVKPCERCILTTVDVQQGQFRASQEPLATLSLFRANERGGVFFGQNLVALNEGMIHRGAPVEVIEYKDKEFYADNSPLKQTLTCVEREEIARDFVTFWLEPCHGEIPHYLPGQHLPIEVEIDGKVASRYYSLSSSPSRPGRLAISVKRLSAGKVSNWLLDHFQVGDVLSSQTPDGHFHIGAHQHQPLLLLSAGSGVTPMLSMLRYLADHQQLQDVIFYHQCRSREDIPYRQELEQLHQQHPGLEVIIALSNSDDQWQGQKGRLSLSHLKQLPNLTQRQVFVCGPDGFMAKARNLLSKMGLADSQYHQESFGVATAVNEPEKSVQLSIDGRQIEGNNQQTLLEQAEDAGLEIIHSCRAGLCGTCKVRVEQGDVHQPDVPGLKADERKQGVVLACCCIPRTDLEVVSL